MPNYRNNYLLLALLTAFWLVMIAIVNPVGNFPLNDDWMYARSVFYLLNQGHYKVTESYSPVLIAQVGWGFLFCCIKGFSFTALRISTLVLGLIGIFFFYFLVNNLTGNKVLSFFASSLLLINPLYFSLSSSFMTDIPFLSLVMVSMFYFFRAIQTHQRKYIFIATIFSILATLIRQLGVVIPLAFAIVALLRKDQNIKQKIKNFIPFIVTVFALIIVLVWLNNVVHSGIHFFQSGSMKPLFKSIIPKFYIRTGYVLIYSGLFLFPALVFIVKKSFKELTSFNKKAVAVVILLMIPSFVCVYHNFPCNNMVNNGFIGPHTMRDAYVYHVPELYTFPPQVLLTIFLFGVVGAIMIIINLWNIGSRILKEYKNGSLALNVNSRLLFVVLCLVGYCLLIFPPDLYIDRYVVPCIPLIWIIICTQEVGRIKIPVLVFTGFYILAIGAFTTLSTHDWLEWNRARWSGVTYLTQDCKIPADKIDAGYEDNGWLLGGEFSKHTDKTWWFVDDNEYILALRKVPGYQTIKEFNYTNYFPYEQRSLLVLQKQKY
jgi:4-amino-4-deoxy-L-arabinose transferase-like glycosyltransferase